MKATSSCKMLLKQETWEKSMMLVGCHEPGEWRQDNTTGVLFVNTTIT